MTRFQVSVWDNKKLDDRLEQLWGQGYSCAVIAAMLNAEFSGYFRKQCYLPNGITKNSVIGRVHRRKLPERGWSWNGMASSMAKNSGAYAKRVKAGLTLRPGPKPNRPPKPQRAPQTPKREVVAITIAEPPDKASWVAWEDLDLATQCRRVWGEIGHGHGHCGKPVIPGQAWCHECRKAVYMPIEVSRRRRVRDGDTTDKVTEIKRLQEQFG